IFTADAEGLGEGVIQHVGDVPLLLVPRCLKRVVVGEHLVVDDVHSTVRLERSRILDDGAVESSICAAGRACPAVSCRAAGWIAVRQPAGYLEQTPEEIVVN